MISIRSSSQRTSDLNVCLVYASLALKAFLLSGRNLIAYPLPIGGKVAEAL